ncbi:PRC-barrel domain-containing protein [Deinococcus sp.]|uniref:PRC-barrel domain-containing protein n=1 Tax=Deinococcus sp. TaxID=47478 RepID=UPI003C7A0DE5
MHRGKEVIGKKIAALTGEVHADVVRDLIFDPHGQRLLGLLVDEGGWFHAARVIPFGGVRSIGEDAVMVDSLSAVVSAQEVPGMAEVLSGNQKLIGTPLMTTEGEDLGTLADLYFDEASGHVTGYDMSGGVFADLSGGRSFVPAASELMLGKDVALVPPEVARAMEEQEPGGLKKVLGTVGDSVKSAAGTVGGAVRETAGNLADATKERQRVFVVGKVASGEVATREGTVLVRAGDTITAEQASEAERLGLLGTLTAVAGGGALQEAYGNVRESVQGGYENLAAASKERQQAFVVGKVAGSDVTAPDGFEVVKKGEMVTEWHATSADTHGALGRLVASATGGALQQGVSAAQERLAPVGPVAVEDALGRRVQTDVRGSAGSLVAPAGQIVTPAVVERARLLGKESELLAAVNLSVPVSQRLGQTGTQVGEQLSATAQQMQEGAGNVLEQARNWLGETRTKAADAAEERRIENAVGRPVNRVVLDKADTIILNIGEIITHRAVELARASDVLGILLGSVSGETPKIDPLESRPTEHGQAALASQKTGED